MKKEHYSVFAVFGTIRKTILNSNDLQIAIKLADKKTAKETDTIVYQVYDNVAKKIVYKPTK